MKGSGACWIVAMSEKLDGLFGGEPGFPERKSRVKTVRVLLVIGSIMIGLGLLGCVGYPYFVLTWLSVPGAALVLWAWALADSDLSRVESGHLGFELGPDLQTFRKWALVVLVLAALSFAVQMKFLLDGTYEVWLKQLRE
jgi:hypothetical protein